VTVEQNAFGGYWVARNRDAHAWVEAYDESRGWFIVEATVAEGVPSDDTIEKPSRVGALWDYARFLVRELVSAYVVGGIRGLMHWLGDALVRLGSRLLSPVPVAVLVLVTGAMLWRSRRKRRVTREKPEPAYRVELRGLLSAMDERLQRQGIERGPHETVVQFASRVTDAIADVATAAHAAQWYRTYARLRFGAHPTPEEIGELREGLVEFDGQA
jgi:transglutaminase-like putative cysteine protease